MSVDTPEQLKGLRRAGRVVAQTLQVVKAAVAPGVSTGELDRIAADVPCASHGARSGPILTYGYPGSICISVDDQVVHGIPGERVLRAGELVTLDVAAEVDGYHADAAIDGPGRRRRRAARKHVMTPPAPPCRRASAGAARRDAGRRRRCDRAHHPGHGFQVFRELTGHGIGREMHEEPTVFNWAAPQATDVLEPGLVITIEPMVAAGGTATPARARRLDGAQRRPLAVGP